MFKHAKTLRLAIAIASVAALAVAASAASATVNTGPGHAPVYSEQWGDCHVTVGAVKTQDGAAMGGVDVVCNHYRRYINLQVTEYRYTSSGWRESSASAWKSVYNSYWSSQNTGAPCYRGYGSWYTRAVVNVDGYQQTFESPVANYAPPC